MRRKMVTGRKTALLIVALLVTVSCSGDRKGQEAQASAYVSDMWEHDINLQINFILKLQRDLEDGDLNDAKIRVNEKVEDLKGMAGFFEGVTGRKAAFASRLVELVELEVEPEDYRGRPLVIDDEPVGGTR